MQEINRRGFFGKTITGMTAAGLAFHGIRNRPYELLAADSSPAPVTGGIDTLFLTWQQDPTTTVTIQWVDSEVSRTPGIQFRQTSGMIWQRAKVRTKPFPGTDLKVHRCELTGLTPGTDYTFQIDGTIPEFHCRTMPAKATDGFWFVSGGDSGVNDAAVSSNLLAAKQDPYFVVMGGDVAYDNGQSPEIFLGFLRNYHRTMVDSQGRLIPLVSCLGNHEVSKTTKKKRDGAGSYLSVFDGLFADQTYQVLDFGDYFSLVLLDTDHISPVEGEQTSWLKKVLAEREDHPHVFTAYHVPAYPSYRKPWGDDPEKKYTGEEQRKNWCPLFERYKVNVVLEHHDHTFKRSHPLTDGQIDLKAGVLYLGDGSWGKIRAPKSPDDRPYLAKTGESYHISLHRLEGEQRFHLALTGTGKVADIVTSVKNRPSV